MRQSQFAYSSRYCIAFFGPLPELPGVASLERHHVFLRLVNKNAISFFHHLVGAHRYCHFNFFNIPFLPGAFVQATSSNPSPIHRHLLLSFLMLQKQYQGKLCVCHADRQDRRRKIPGAVLSPVTSPLLICTSSSPIGFFSMVPVS